MSSTRELVDDYDEAHDRLINTLRYYVSQCIDGVVMNGDHKSDHGRHYIDKSSVKTTTGEAHVKGVQGGTAVFIFNRPGTRTVAHLNPANLEQEALRAALEAHIFAVNDNADIMAPTKKDGEIVQRQLTVVFPYMEPQVSIYRLDDPKPGYSAGSYEWWVKENEDEIIKDFVPGGPVRE